MVWTATDNTTGPPMSVNIHDDTTKEYLFDTSSDLGRLQLDYLQTLLDAQTTACLAPRASSSVRAAWIWVPVAARSPAGWPSVPARAGRSSPSTWIPTTWSSSRESRCSATTSTTACLPADRST